MKLNVAVQMDPIERINIRGDSTFALLLEEIFQTRVPISAIVSPAANPERWARFIEAAQAGGEAVSFAKVHGEGAKTIRAADLDLSLFLDAETLEQAGQVPPPGETKTVLLTGASGYLGRFLCLEWLEELAPKGGKVVYTARTKLSADGKTLTADVKGVDGRGKTVDGTLVLDKQ